MCVIPESIAKKIAIIFSLALVSVLLQLSSLPARDLWRVYEGHGGPGRGKHIVLVSGDEEYRSEEALPQLAGILAQHHGFRCTVLFAIDPATGIINPNQRHNIPGLEALRTADLLIIATRFRDLPDHQMALVDQYLKSGRPVIGMRTATHAFQIEEGGKYAHYGNGYAGERKAWTDGFGRLVLGERWVRHHGRHKHESTRGVIHADARSSPIARGIGDGDIWADTDVYAVRIPLGGDSRAIVMGQVLDGMTADSKPVTGPKNAPMMPIAWTKSYQLPGGKKGKAFATTMGAATDLAASGTRRLIVNAVYWSLGMVEKIPAGGSKVDTVKEYAPSPYGFHPGEYWQEKKMRP